MVTNNSKFQIRQGLDKIARLRATGMVFAALLTVFAANLSAQMRGHDGDRHNSTRHVNRRDVDRRDHSRSDRHVARHAPSGHSRFAGHGNFRRHGRYIPDHHFRSHFGRHHRFHMGRPVIVAGVPRFQYGGFSFGILDPWPPVWRYNSALYVENIDGQYYLCNPLDPAVRIAIEVLG